MISSEFFLNNDMGNSLNLSYFLDPEIFCAHQVDLSLNEKYFKYVPLCLTKILTYKLEFTLFTISGFDSKKSFLLFLKYKNILDNHFNDKILDSVITSKMSQFGIKDFSNIEFYDILLEHKGIVSYEDNREIKYLIDSLNNKSNNDSTYTYHRTIFEFLFELDEDKTIAFIDSLDNEKHMYEIACHCVRLNAVWHSKKFLASLSKMLNRLQIDSKLYKNIKNDIDLAFADFEKEEKYRIENPILPPPLEWMQPFSNKLKVHISFLKKLQTAIIPLLEKEFGAKLIFDEHSSLGSNGKIEEYYKQESGIFYYKVHCHVFFNKITTDYVDYFLSWHDSSDNRNKINHKEDVSDRNLKFELEKVIFDVDLW